MKSEKMTRILEEIQKTIYSPICSSKVWKKKLEWAVGALRELCTTDHTRPNLKISERNG